MSIVKTITTLYKDLPEEFQDRMAEMHRLEYMKPARHINQIESNPPNDMSLETLDSYENSIALSLLLTHLPGDKIIEHFGESALLWAFVNVPYLSEHNKLADDIKTYLGRDPEKIDKARLTTWRTLHSKKMSEIIPITRTLEKLDNDYLSEITLEEILQKCAHSGVKLSQKRIRDYSLSVMSPKQEMGWESVWRGKKSKSGKSVHSVYMDTPIGIGLMYKEEPSAVVGFLPRENVFMIEQLQGIRAKVIDDFKVVDSVCSRGIMPLDWQKLLVGISYRVGLDLNFRQLSILGGPNNIWVGQKNPDKKAHITLDHAIKSYDAVAERLEFTKGNDNNWYTDIIRS